ncbi:hypothetical protein GCM10010156_50410 [Planobispora rosea]|uniref:Uncharacterized protein n=1 Tax=Planobispora rosea TaxID=35762 RepID=A0A8J3S082_PLARO|nr:hypothetical protein GCM10010156_50410 [Planobispora rosea]GIH83352.1 hypothetical protein Pro02_17600 [Planobispora rosea]
MSARINGSATFSIATSIPSRKIAPHNTNNTPQARPSMRALDADIRRLLSMRTEPAGYQDDCRFPLVTESIFSHHR